MPENEEHGDAEVMGEHPSEQRTPPEPEPPPVQPPPLSDAEFDAVTAKTQLQAAKEGALAKLQALFDAKIAAAHEWASKQGGFPAVKLTLEELEEVFK